MKNKVFAILRAEEEECGHFQHRFCYKFKYNKQDEFFVKVDGVWIEAPSTVFDFIHLKR